MKKHRISYRGRRPGNKYRKSFRRKNELTMKAGNKTIIGDALKNDFDEFDKCEEPVCISSHRSSVYPVTNENPWFLIGASVIGNGHIHQHFPCQDAHKIEIWGKGWGIAIVSDGAGSSKRSHLSSSYLVKEAARKSFELIDLKRWMEQEILPDEEEWDKAARILLSDLQDALRSHAHYLEVSLGDLHATLIINIFSPKGLLTVHIGDGRSGYVTENGIVHSSMNPFEGEQVGETVFITMDMEKHKEIVETRVIGEPVSAFFLLSDGCESVCWETIQQDKESGKFIRPNKPFEPFFRHIIKAFGEMQKTIKPELLSEKWYNYLKNGHKGFVQERDDKTMVIGFLP